jgi:hypothetical protein
MVTLHKTLAALALGLAVTAGVSPALAQGRANYIGEVTPARAAALRACTAQENKFVEYNWGSQEVEIYRACMAQHGQPE